MSKDLIPASLWDASDKEETEEEKQYFNIGYVLGKYTDLDFSFVKNEGKVEVKCSQNLKLDSLFSDIMNLWDD